MDKALLSMLVCPLCKGPLILSKKSNPMELICPADRLAFPIRDQIPIMLQDHARSLNPDEDISS